MIKNMLQAASKMLGASKEEKVICAKIIIDEIITSLGGDDLIPIEDVPSLKSPSKKKPSNKDEGLPEVGVKDGKLVEVKNVPLDGLVKLNGVDMPLAEAIGKNFENIEILWRP